MLTLTECPCKCCVPPKRTPTCHPSCKVYLTWKKELNEFNKKLREKRRYENIADNCHRVKKGRNR